MRSVLKLIAFSALLFCGCSSSNLPPQTEAAKGRELLKQVMDAWVQGGKPEDLKTANPPIIVNDPDWSAGAKLTKYEVDSEDKRIGVDLLLSVTLNLTKPDGGTQKKTVNYSVAIATSNVVLRKE